MNTTEPMQRHAQLVAALREQLGGAEVETIETHILTVLLAGEFAYKLKKPVDLGLLNFTSLQARRRYCELQLHLNRRTAPQIYLDVLAITAGVHTPRLGVAGEPIEYAVRMRRFAAEDLLAARARRPARRRLHRPAGGGDRGVSPRGAARRCGQPARHRRHGRALDARQRRRSARARRRQHGPRAR